MSPGTYISLTLHASLVGWLLFNGDFENKPLKLPPHIVVKLVSSEMFDIMVNNTAPIMETELDTVAAQPMIENTQAPPESSNDKAPQQVTQTLSPIALNDALPEAVPDQPERMEEVVIIPPLELTAPEIEGEGPEPLATSLPPKPRPAPRIAPVAVAPPAADMDIGEITRDTASPQLEPAQVLKEQTAKAPEAAAPVIVTEAEKPSEAVEVSKLAPPRSVRPQRRPAPRPMVETPIDTPESTSVQITPVDAALAEALSGTTSEPETQGAATEALNNQIQSVIKNAIRPCWNVGFLSTAALSTIVRVRIDFTSEGKPLENGITFEDAEGGDAKSAQQMFEAARSAIKDCGARGFNLPKNEFSVWRTLIFKFDPVKMR